MTYFLGWDLDADLLDCLGELIWLDGSIVIKIKVLECLLEHRLFGLGTLGLLGKFGF
jgi:hypothetical protein